MSSRPYRAGAGPSISSVSVSGSSSSPMAGGVDNNEVDGEPVLFSARLSSAWTTYRRVTCGLGMLAAGGGAGLLFAAPYCLCGGGCRAEEARSFSLLLTASAVHYRMKVYDCGCCCQRTVTKTIPLDKVQDIVLVADCCGDVCGFAGVQGAPYQLHVQTAGGGGPDTPAELSVMCIEDPDGFRARVLAAKRALLVGLGSAGGRAGAGAHGAYGAGKEAPSFPPSVVVSGAEAGVATTFNYGGSGAGGFHHPALGPAAAEADSRAALAVLTRIEHLLETGVGMLQARERTEGGR